MMVDCWLFVDILPVTDRDGCDHQLVVEDLANDSVVPYPITPEPAFFAVQGFAAGAWIFEYRDLIFEIVEDGGLPALIDLA